MSSDLKPVVFRIVLETADAQKQLDALSKGGGKGSPDGKGVPQAPKPQPGGAGAPAGTSGLPGGGAPTSPGTPGQPGQPGAPGAAGRAGATGATGATGARGAAGAAGAAGRAAGAASAAAPTSFVSRFATSLGFINRAILSPVPTAAGVAGAAGSGALGALVGGAAKVAAPVAIVAGAATFLEQVVPLVLSKLATELPDMPFFKEWAKEFDNTVSDQLTTMRTWVTSIIPAVVETAQVERAAALVGGSAAKGGVAGGLDIGGRLFDIEHQKERLQADVTKEMNKKVASAFYDAISGKNK